MKNRICFVSVDVEDNEGTENLDKILDIFKKYNLPATLFITGEVLQKYRKLAQEWSQNYEIASHSFTHRFWNTLNLTERQAELNNFIEFYQNIFQKNPRGFRAPSHIIDEEGLKLLEEKGFLYDSSIVPHYPLFKKYRGYLKKAPLEPYCPKAMKILELPVTGQILGIPLAGTWIKKLPFLFYKILFLIYRPDFLTLNLHSWDSLSPQLLKKLEKILKILKNKKYQFLNGEQILKNRQ